ncbi:MAG: hypothetical protein ACRDI0_09060 [Actinomycetota bacterium]
MTGGATIPEEDTHRTGRLAFVVLVATLVGVAAFFLVRPLLSGLPAFRPRPAGSPFAYWYLVLAAFVPYWVVVFRRIALPSPTVLLAVAAVVYLLLVAAQAQQSQDVYQYLVYGKMTGAGVNPYVVAPFRFDDPWLAFSRWDDTTTVYGPVWTLLTAGVTRLAGDSLLGGFLGVKVLTAVLAVGAAALLARALSVSPDRAGRAVVAFAYNPLVVFSVGLGAHADATVAAALAGAVLAERRGRVLGTTLLVTAAALVKAYAGLALVAWLIAVARRRGARAALVHGGSAVALAVAAYAPFWAGASTLSGIGRVGRLASASLAGSVVRALAGMSQRRRRRCLAGGGGPADRGRRGPGRGGGLGGPLPQEHEGAVADGGGPVRRLSPGDAVVPAVAPGGAAGPGRRHRPVGDLRGAVGVRRDLAHRGRWNGPAPRRPGDPGPPGADHPPLRSAPGGPGWGAPARPPGTLPGPALTLVSAVF